MFVYTKLQYTLEQAEQLHHTISPENKPFMHKYKAWEMLKDLMKHPLINLKSVNSKPEENRYLIYLSNALILWWLGKNYFDSEEISASLKYFSLSLWLFDTLSDRLKIWFLNSIQDVYNHIGIIHCNKDWF